MSVVYFSCIGDVIVDCELLMYETEELTDATTHRCRVRKPYPLRRDDSISFIIEFPLENRAALREFVANFTVKTEEQNGHQSTQFIKLPIKSEYGLKIEGYVRILFYRVLFRIQWYQLLEVT